MGHLLKNKNIEKRTAECKICGPVKIVLNGVNTDGRKRWRCSILINSKYIKGDVKRKRKIKKKIGGVLIPINILNQDCCQICGIGESENKKALSVDHCHSTLNIRGRLCHHCNVGIGLFKDDTKLLENAIQYLNNSRELKKVI